MENEELNTGELSRMMNVTQENNNCQNAQFFKSCIFNVNIPFATTTSRINLKIKNYFKSFHL